MKKLYLILPLALLLCFTVGCQDKAVMAEVEEQNKEVIRNYLNEMDNQNFESLYEAYAPDAKIYYPSNSSESMSIEQAIPMAKSFYAAFPDFTHSIEELISVGNTVILRSVDRGTHPGQRYRPGFPEQEPAAGGSHNK